MNRSPVSYARATGEFPAVPASLADVRRFVREHAARSGLSDRGRDELVLAVSEAATNAVRHSGSSTMRLRWRANGRRVVVTVEDRGIFRPGRPAPGEQRSIEPRMPGGYGLTLMSASTDELHLREGFEGSPGTRVRLVKRVPPRARRTLWTMWTHLARAAEPPVGLPGSGGRWRPPW
jgi:anti-sigma regulatory factor (Ser/Thr protein kinase)